MIDERFIGYNGTTREIGEWANYLESRKLTFIKSNMIRDVNLLRGHVKTTIIRIRTIT